VVLAAVAHNWKALRFAAMGLQQGGLRAYMDGLALARRSLLFFLLAARYRPRLSAIEQSDGLSPHYVQVSPTQSILTKLNAHGIYFAMKFKSLIAAFVGAPVGQLLTALNIAFRTASRNVKKVESSRNGEQNGKHTFS